MLLKELTFSDIILLQDGSSYLKGTLEAEQQLVNVSNQIELQEELKTLLEAVEQHKNREGCFRVRHQGIGYRAAGVHGVDGNAYFLRRLATSIPDFTALDFPEGYTSWLLDSEQSKGLVLFCGSQGSGKSTSAASFIAARLKKHGGHAITFENPVELPLTGSHGEGGYCFQTELADETCLARHIEHAHRFSSPNIVFIGEIRSKYAASEALKLSLGSNHQLVVATVHGLDIISALDRLLGWAQELDGEIACQNLAQALLCAVYQDLEDTGQSRRLRTPQILFVPFKDSSKSIRSKIRERYLTSLEEDIREQRNRLRLYGISAL